eukprot:2440649-Amphidinium_carterae.1
MPTSKATSARKPRSGVQVALSWLQHGIANDPQQPCTKATASCCRWEEVHKMPTQSVSIPGKCHTMPI